MIYAKFKKVQHPCVIYRIIEQNNREWELDILGNIPAFLLEETEEYYGDINAIDLAIKLVES